MILTTNTNKSEKLTLIYVTDDSVSLLSLKAMSQIALMNKAYVTLFEDYWSALSFLLIPLFA